VKRLVSLEPWQEKIMLRNVPWLPNEPLLDFEAIPPPKQCCEGLFRQRQTRKNMGRGHGARSTSQAVLRGSLPAAADPQEHGQRPWGEGGGKTRLTPFNATDRR
jgi:hypothetical protein